MKISISSQKNTEKHEIRFIHTDFGWRLECSCQHFTGHAHTLQMAYELGEEHLAETVLLYGTMG